MARHGRVMPLAPLICLLILLTLLGNACDSTGASETSTLPASASTAGVQVSRIELQLYEWFPVEASVLVRGELPGGCWSIDGVEQNLVGQTIEVRLTPSMQQAADCGTEPKLFKKMVELDLKGLTAGVYTVDVHGVRRRFELRFDNVDLEAGMIGGRVWRDVCGLSGIAGGMPSTPWTGCEPAAGGYRPNGRHDPDEPGIEGVVVTLALGSCPGDELATQTTDVKGLYAFHELEPGTYCVRVNWVSGPNATLLTDGHWTAPGVGLGETTLSLAEAEQRIAVDFGWALDVLPAD
jgi:hypothetical protein